ncbi:MAG: recombinase family protein [Clostridia bacterium]|nr:recombinase family protein [Clostridia bacterium]
MARTSRKKNRQTNNIISKHYHVAIYVRLSLENSGDTLQNQINIIKNHIEQQDMTYDYDVYCDNGITGTTFDRPAFNKMMDDVRNGKVNCIAVKDLSRFGRNQIETANYLEKIFPYLDIRFIAVKDNFDTLTAERMGADIVSLKNILNEIYSKELSKKVRSVLKQKQQAGYYIGGFACYGYLKSQNEKGKLVIDVETAPIVKEIFELKIQGVNYADIARILDSKDISPPNKYKYEKGILKNEKFKNLKWNGATVKSILTNQMYIGNMVQGVHRSSLEEGIKNKKMPKEEWTIIQNTHEAIIDKATFSEVQDICEAVTSIHSYKRDDMSLIENPYKDIIYCECCGKKLYRHRLKPRKNQRIFFEYFCPTRKKNKECDVTSINKNILDKVVLKILHHQHILAVDMKKKIEGLNQDSNIASFNAAIQKRIDDILKLLNKKKRAYESYFSNVLDKDEYLYQIKKYNKKEDILKQQISSLEKEKKLNLKSNIQNNNWVQNFLKLNTSDEISKHLIHCFVERITINKNKDVTVTVKYQDEFVLLSKNLGKKGIAV